MSRTQNMMRHNSFHTVFNIDQVIAVACSLGYLVLAVVLPIAIITIKQIYSEVSEALSFGFEVPKYFQGCRLERVLCFISRG